MIYWNYYWMFVVNRKMHGWKHKDIKYDTVKFTFLIHFVLVLISHREVRNEWFCGWFRKFRNYLTTQTQVSDNFLKDTVFSLMMLLSLYERCFFFLDCRVQLNMEQDLQQWPWFIRALWEEGGVKHLSGPARLLHEQHRVFALCRAHILRWS